MSAFDDFSSDIDRTPRGRPYVVDSNGWGCATLVYLAILPFVLFGMLISKVALFVADHIILFLILYCIFTLAYSFLLYHGTVKHRFWGIMAVFLTTLPVALLLICYVIPFTVLCPSFDSVLDFIIVAALLVGGEVLIYSLCRIWKNGLKHFLMAVLFLIITLFILYIGLMSEHETLTFANICSVYGL